MAQYTVMVELVVEADSENDAFLCAESAVENMVGGDILSASVDSVSDTND